MTFTLGIGITIFIKVLKETDPLDQPGVFGVWDSPWLLVGRASLPGLLSSSLVSYSVSCCWEEIP